jgi:ssDNA-binding Zn-finger/Zn-ribbon topoisomerase 1
MVLRQLNDKSGYLIGCSGYPQCTRCVYLPKSASSVTVTNEVCPDCKPGPVYLINMKFKPGSMPTSIPLECITCVFCEDSILKGFLTHSTSKAKVTTSPKSSKRRKLSKSSVEKGQMKLDSLLQHKSKKQL